MLRESGPQTKTHDWPKSTIPWEGVTLFTLANGWWKDRDVTLSSQERILIPSNSDEEVLEKVPLVDKMTLVRRILCSFEHRFRRI